MRNQFYNKFLIFSSIFLLFLISQSDARTNPFRRLFLLSSDLNPANLSCFTDKCVIDNNWTQQEICRYVDCNDDACEGGGYLLWTQYIECASSTADRVILIIIGILYMCFLFVAVSTAADEFFSPSISSIVAHLRISESVAGVTFMAFGNGAPDVFGSIASVLSSPTPKADLALGELFGGGLFVITMVVATIVLTSPFDVDVFSTIRDLIFYLVAVCFIAICFIFSNHVSLWMPLTYLGIYLLYVLTVFVAQALHNRNKKKVNKDGSRKSHRSTVVPASPSQIPEIHIISEAIDRLRDHVESNAKHSRMLMKRASYMFHNDGLQNILQPYSHSITTNYSNSSEEEFVVVHGHVFHGHQARSRAASLVPEPMQINSWRSMDILTDLWKHLKPWPDRDEWEEMGIISKIVSAVSIIAVFFFCLTIPLNEMSWSKPIALIHSFTCPIFLLFSLQLLFIVPFPGSPGLWVYGLSLSIVIAICVIFFTHLSIQPKFYKEFYSYTGFLMSIAWIYLISSEVVNVVTMLGVVSRISHEVLGLTILAWSNSIGDLIADVSVVKQGYPRMAMAAAIGGPLFNLLMGFGIPFSIAKLQGKYISMTINPTYRLLMLFLVISLLTILIGLPIQKFRIQRPHAAILIAIYIIFIVFVLLSETNVLVWN